jgi:hypothetical protein
MREICVDTGFLIGLYNPDDQFYIKAQHYFSDYFRGAANRLLIPWPILYETISTRMASNKQAMFHLENDWKKLALQNRLGFLPDEEFRAGLVEECFADLGRPLGRRRSLSLVDRIIRRILSDTSIRIHAFVTFNPEDFADVCTRARREMLY